MIAKNLAYRGSRVLATGFMFVVVFGAGFLIGSHNGTLNAQDSGRPDTTQLFAPFWQVYDLIHTDYVDPNNNTVTPEQLVDGAIQGMVDALGDEFSGYMPPDVYQMQNEYLEGEFEGIGATIRTLENDGGIEVVSVFENSPAQQAGVQPGDIFVAVNGESVTGFNQSQVALKVRGPAGTEVVVTMKRGEELIDFIIIRARIEIPNIEARIEDGNIGYIRLFQFTSDARQQLDNAARSIDVENLDGLILDLRGNPGGLLNTAVDIASAFISEGVILVEDFGGDQEPVIFKATGSYLNIDVPLVLLVDKGSASASELVAGALQDADRATIIGETTFGKGTVQTWRQLANGGGVRLTIARWTTPDGNWIHQQGITPDVEVVLTQDDRDADRDPQLDAALDFLLAQQPES